MVILDIGLHNACNYSCDYCIAKSYKCDNCGHFLNNVIPSHSINPAILEDWIKSNFAADSVILNFGGGEPLLYPALRYLLQDLILYKKVITTNAKHIKEFLQIYPQAAKDCRLFWKLSWHPTMAKFEDFIKQIEPLPKARAIINYVVHPARIAHKSHTHANQAMEHIAWVKDSGYAYNLNAFMGVFDGTEYSRLDPIYNDFDIFDTPSEVGKMLFIEPNGDFQACYKTKIGNIYTDKSFPFEQYTRDFCQKENGITTCDCFQAIKKLLRGQNEQ